MELRNLTRIPFLFLYLSGSSLFALDITIRVFDPKTAKNVPDVQVIILETKTKLFTGADGTTRAEVPAAGVYTFRTILPGGTLIQPRLAVRFSGEIVTIYTSALPKDATADEEGIVVTGFKEKSKLSRYQVRIDEVKRVPGSFGEALRGVELLPGVSAPPFGSGEIHIRGANDNANMYFIDDLPIGYPYHIFPINSVIHNDFIKSIDVYSGAYPTNYGNATGGIISIESIDKVEKAGGNVSFSLWSANALYKDTIGKSGYWIAAGRMSYMDVTLKPYLPDGVRAPIFWDGQVKAKINLTKSQDLYLYSFGAKDMFAAKVSDKPAWDPTTDLDPILIGARIDFNRAFHTEAIRHVWNLGSRLQNRLTLYFTENLFYFDGEIGIFKARQTLSNSYGGVREEVGWEVIKDHAYLDAGIEARSYAYRYFGDTIVPSDPANPHPDPFKRTNPDFETIPVDDSMQAGYNSGWATLTLRAKGLEIKPGVRTDYFGITKQSVTSPRGTISYTLPTKTVFIAGAGVYHRLPDLNQFSSSSGNPDLRFERSEHYGAGIEQTYKKWLFKIEGFRHNFTNNVVQDQYITTPYRINEDYIRRRSDPALYIKTEVLNPADRNNDLILYNQRKVYSNDGTASSVGYELYIKKENPPDKNGWYGWISYTWSKTMQNDHQHVLTEWEKNTVYSADERRIVNQYDNAKELYADYDRTHIVNVVLGYRITREWQIGGRWKYLTANPYTPITGDDGGRTLSNGRVMFNPEYSDYRNSQRVKPFHRLDFRVDRFFNYSWGYGNFFFEALNLYLRKNVTGMGWSNGSPYSRTNPSEQYDFGLLQIPSGKKRYLVPLFNLGLEVKF